MALCTECGKQIPDGTKFCPYCDAQVEAAPEAPREAAPEAAPETATPTSFGGQLSNYFNVSGPLPTGEEKTDAEQNKVWGILAYVFFVIPLIGAKDSKFARFHANNSLWILILYAALGIIEGIFSGIAAATYSGFFSFLAGLTGFTMLVPTVLWVFGLIHAIKGLKKDLPLVGNIKIFK